MAQAILFWIFWAFVAIFIDKNDSLVFFPFILIIAAHICIASGAKLSFASVFKFVFNMLLKKILV